MDMEKKPLPDWVKYLIAACVGAGAQTGTQKALTDSPVHFAVEGEAPSAADGWSCQPEGGIIGAPMVCRPKDEIVLDSSSTETEVSDSE